MKSWPLGYKEYHAEAEYFRSGANAHNFGLSKHTLGWTAPSSRPAKWNSEIIGKLSENEDTVVQHMSNQIIVEIIIF